jgi:toluene monooxygenase system protein B
MAQLPLASSFEGDFIVKLVLVDEDDTMDQVAVRTASHTAGRTVRARPPGVMRVRLQGAAQPFQRDATVRAVGLTALATIEVFHEAVSV